MSYGTDRQRREEREARVFKEKLASSAPIRATTSQCHILKKYGIFCDPATHSFEEASEIIDRVIDRPTRPQKQFARSLGIDPTGLTKVELSDRIEEAVKARDAKRAVEPAPLPRTPAKRVKATGLARHSLPSLVRALVARRLSMEAIAAALEAGKLMAAAHALSANRLWLEKTMQSTGPLAPLTADDETALGVAGVK